MARRLRGVRHVVAMDLRGHGLSDAPTEAVRRPATLAERCRRGRGGIRPPGRQPDDRVVLAGHGFGAIVAAWAAVDARRAVRRAGPRRWRLGVDSRRRPAWSRGVPARPRRAARGDALDDRVPRRSRRASTRRPGTRTRSAPRGDGRRDARRQGRARRRGRTRSRRACGRCSRYDPLATLAAVGRPVVALAAADDEAGSRAAALAAASRRPGRRRAAVAIRRGVVRARRAQPDALPSGGGQRGDPVGRRRRRLTSGGPIAMQVVYSPAHLGHDITLETYMGVPVPANEVAERAELIRDRPRGRRRVRARRADRARRGADHGRPRPGARAVPGGGLVGGPRARASTAPFLSADTYPNRAMFEGMSADGRRARWCANPSTSAVGPGSGASTRRRRWWPGRTSRRAPRSTWR